jgi:hypothetical protein
MKAFKKEKNRQLHNVNSKVYLGRVITEIILAVQKTENTAVGIRHADHVAPSIPVMANL